eukprot:501057_1
MNINNTTQTYFNSLYNGSDIIICGKIENYKQNYINDTIDSSYVKDLNKSNEIEGKIYEEDDNTEEKLSDNTNCLCVIIAAKSGKLNSDKNEIKAVNINKKLSFKMDDIMNNTLEENTENIERIWAYWLIQNSYNLTYENLNFSEKNEKKKYFVDLSMKFKFVTPYTNMIVVEKEQKILKDTGPQIKRNIKLIVAGDYNCGKTELLLKYTQNNINNTKTNIFHKNVIVNENDIDLVIWDIPNGQEKYSQFNLDPIYLRNTDGILYVCSINDLKSQNNIKKWMNNIKRYVNMTNNETNSMLIVNKSDLICDENEMNKITKRLEILSNDLGIKYIITSAKNNINVSNAFKNVLTGICKRLNINDKYLNYVPYDEDNLSYEGMQRSIKSGLSGFLKTDKLVGNGSNDTYDMHSFNSNRMKRSGRRYRRSVRLNNSIESSAYAQKACC